MAAGYSKSSLVHKLGIKDGFKVALVDAPENYAHILGKLPGNVQVSRSARRELDFIQFFCMSKQNLEEKFPSLKSALSPKGMLWISWPKGASAIETDLNENVVREIGLKHGLVDVKVCAVDETWSGLKFVFRVKDRK
jgi:hypothetical protein